MCLASKLSRKNIRVSVFEREHQLGGLATWEDYDQFFWDRFYHVILPNDSYLLTFLKECGLQEKLCWEKTRTGYYVDGQFHSVSNSKEFLLFPPLSMASKLRLAFTIYYGSMVKDWRKLEKITTKDCLIKLGGSKNYHKFWKPLLLAKLGEFHDKVSAVFIWTYIKRLFEARENASTEQMGYINGSYKVVFDQLEKIVESNNGKVHLNTSVKNIRPIDSGKIVIETEEGVSEFDKVVFTAPTSLADRLVSPDLLQVDNLHKIEYLGVVCLVMVTKREVSPYYVLNIADDTIPFTGVIGMSSLVNTKYTDGKYLTYFPKYVKSSSPLINREDEQILSDFMEGFYKLYPGFDSGDIISTHIHRAKRVQPIQLLNYSQSIPAVNTLHPNFYMLNTSQFVNDTLNNNSVAKHVENFLQSSPEILKNQQPIFNRVN